MTIAVLVTHPTSRPSHREQHGAELTERHGEGRQRAEEQRPRHLVQIPEEPRAARGESFGKMDPVVIEGDDLY